MGLIYLVRVMCCHSAVRAEPHCPLPSSAPTGVHPNPAASPLVAQHPWSPGACLPIAMPAWGLSVAPSELRGDVLIPPLYRAARPQLAGEVDFAAPPSHLCPRQREPPGLWLSPPTPCPISLSISSHAALTPFYVVPRFRAISLLRSVSTCDDTGVVRCSVCPINE